MRFVRSDSPEVVHGIALSKTLARRHLPVFVLSLLPNVVILFIVLLSLMVSVRAAAWVGLPALLAWNAWVLWRARSPSLSWLIKCGAGRVYIRLYVGFGRARRRTDLPDVIVFEASEIASMSVRAIDVYIYGPKPKQVEWLMIKPSQSAVESIVDQIPTFLRETSRPSWLSPYLSERVYWADDERRLAVGWTLCRPTVRVFLQKVLREYPSIVIDAEEHSELDLNGIWHGFTSGPDAEQRRMLAQAIRLGFGPDCVKLLHFYRGKPFRECAPYLAEIVEEEAEVEHSSVHSTR